MAMSTVTVFRVGDLRPRQVSAIKKKAERLGVSPASYVKQLIEDDLQLDLMAQRTSLDELPRPFQTALKDVSEQELDRRVAAARNKYRRQSAKRK
jgi:hypothetical protein